MQKKKKCVRFENLSIAKVTETLKRKESCPLGGQRTTELCKSNLQTIAEKEFSFKRGALTM